MRDSHEWDVLLLEEYRANEGQILMTSERTECLLMSLAVVVPLLIVYIVHGGTTSLDVEDQALLPSIREGSSIPFRHCPSVGGNRVKCLVPRITMYMFSYGSIIFVNPSHGTVV